VTIPSKETTTIPASQACLMEPFGYGAAQAIAAAGKPRPTIIEG
jgi:hypothetical protein